MILLEHAKNYLNMGWSVIPLKPKDKVPLIDPWKPFQERKPTFEEVVAWWTQWPMANIGIICGRTSGIIAFDPDSEEAQKFTIDQGGFPVTPQSKTFRGFHYILKYPEHLDVRNSSNKKLLLDVKGEGGYFVAPPSIHPSGHRYQWTDGLSPSDVDPASLRPWMEKYLLDHFNGGPKERVEINPSPEDWQKAKRTISTHSRIMFHLMTPKPEDRSGHDWRLACLCVEEGITDPRMIYQIILNNPHGKAQNYSRGPNKYIEDLVSKCLAQSGVGEDKDGQFPRETIQGLAREYADCFSKYLESPWSFFAFSLLTYLGNVIADRLTLNSAIRPQPRLFTILLGQSADERKSESLKQTVDLFSEALPNDFSPCFGVGSAEGLAERLTKHHKTILIYDELKVFVSKSLLESSVLLPCVNTLFESNRFHSHTKGHSIEVDSGYLSILAASTIDTFTKMWTSTFTDIGFINRLWLVPDRGERKYAIPRPIDEVEKKEIMGKLSSLINAIPTQRRDLEITPDAYGLFEDWYKNVSPSIFTKRLDTYGHRLMILFCANENKTRVTADIVERVLKLLEWQRQVREEYDVIDADSKIARMEETIRRSLRGRPLPRRELQRRTNYNRGGVYIWNTALRNLMSEEVVFDHKRQVYTLKREFFT